MRSLKAAREIHRNAIQGLQNEIAWFTAEKWGEIRTTMDLLYHIDKRIAKMEKEEKGGVS